MNKQTAKKWISALQIEKEQQLYKVNILDFIEIETESIVKAINEQDLDAVLRMLPIYIREVKDLVKKLKENR